jgi:hypothetical protein
LYICVKYRYEKDTLQKFVPLATWSIFGFILLAKIILNARIMHYGFVLAMPASLILIMGLVGLVPQMLQKWFDRGTRF